MNSAPAINMAKVQVVPHDPLWSIYFSTVKVKLTETLKDVPIVAIEHVGSTSIPTLPAKPVLDIDIIVSAENLEKARKRLVEVGYTDLGELGIQGRWAMREPGYDVDDYADGGNAKKGGGAGIGMRMNTYVVLEGCLQLRNHLDVKRMLLENEHLRLEYGDVKKGLVQRGVGIEDYAKGKTEVISGILGVAGWSEEDLETVRGANV
jgi:GrpB-like predicted nucleotidyltransferase (UPF0157 family)